jgi:hypothetical protein
MKHGGELTRHGVSSEYEDPPLLAMQLRLLALSTGRLRRAPDRVEGTPKLPSYNILSISHGRSLRNKDDMGLGSDKLRCLGGDASHISDNDLTPVRVGGARDGTVFFEVDSRPVERVSRGDWPPLRPGMSKMRWKSDKVWRNKGTRNAGLPDPAPNEMTARQESEGRSGN